MERKGDSLRLRKDSKVKERISGIHQEGRHVHPTEKINLQPGRALGERKEIQLPAW